MTSLLTQCLQDIPGESVITVICVVTDRLPTGQI